MSLNTINSVDVVGDQYSDPAIVKSYTTVGLFSAEEKIVDQFFKSESTVLDLGCGAGRTSIALTKKGYRVTAFDLIPEMVDSAKRQAADNHVDIDFRVMDAVHMNFEPESYDHVLFSFNGLEQIPGRMTREKVLRNCFEVLRPGGCFVFTTRSGLALTGRRSLGWGWVALQYLQQRLIKGNMKWEFGDKVRNGYYLNYINPFQCKSVASNLGFKILYFNSEKNILKGKSPNFFTNFSNDIRLYYVLKKV